MQTCNLCFYLSDHGFGHISRNLSIIAEAARRTSGLLYLVCGARHLAFAKENLREMLSPDQLELYREFLPEAIWKAYATQYTKIRHGMLYALHNPEMLEFLPNAELTETSLLARPFHPEQIEAIRSRHSCPIVFVALGMSAQFTQPISVEGVNAHFYTTEGVPLTGSNVTTVPYTTLNTQDYVAAADYVITKAGWGTVAECLLSRKPMALFARDSVLEDRTTISLLEQQGLALKITYEQLADMPQLLERLARVRKPEPSAFTNAAVEIASRLLALTV